MGAHQSKGSERAATANVASSVTQRSYRRSSASPSPSFPVPSSAQSLVLKTPVAEPWYFEDVTTASQEPRHAKYRRYRHPYGVLAGLHAGIGRGGGRGRGGGDGNASPLPPPPPPHVNPIGSSCSGTHTPLCVNTPENVALFMEKLESDINRLLSYCYHGADAESSIALCFVSRLTLQDRAASQRADCKFFPSFQESQRAFYFRLVPVGEQNDRLFIVEYYSAPEYRKVTFVFDTHCWIEFEALLRLFFQQGYRYLMKLFPEEVPLLAHAAPSLEYTADCAAAATCTCSSSAYTYSMSIPTPPPSASHTW